MKRLNIYRPWTRFIKEQNSWSIEDPGEKAQWFIHAFLHRSGPLQTHPINTARNCFCDRGSMAILLLPTQRNISIQTVARSEALWSHLLNISRRDSVPKRSHKITTNAQQNAKPRNIWNHRQPGKGAPGSWKSPVKSSEEERNYIMGWLGPRCWCWGNFVVKRH